MDKQIKVLVCLFLLVGGTVFLGCSTKYEFVVLRDVPKTPSFVVIPPNRYMYETVFANQVEEIIMGLGVKVVRRPATRAVTETVEKGITGLQAEDGKLMQGSGSHQLVESYFAYADLNADYIVHTYSSSEQVRIIKRETGEILVSLNLSHYYNINQGELNKRDIHRKLIAAALHKMGVLTTLQVPR